MTVGYGIIGTGNFADEIIAPALKKTSNASLLAVYDSDIDKARTYALKHDLAQVSESLEALFRVAGLNAVYIATPHKYHAELCIQAARAGKHVICEKPMAFNVADAERMIAESEKNNIKLGICYNSRYHPAHIEARRLIQSGAAGDIRVATVQGGSFISFQGWRLDPSMAGSGVLTGPGVHCIDQLRFILDSEVIEVQAVLDMEPSHPGIEDMAYIILKFASGTRGVIITGIRIPRPDNHTVIYGNKSKIICQNTGGLLPHGIGELIIAGDTGTTTTSFPVAFPSLVKSISAIEAFNNWIEHDIEPYITARNGLEMVKITEAIMESGRTGKAVKVNT